MCVLFVVAVGNAMDVGGVRRKPSDRRAGVGKRILLGGLGAVLRLVARRWGEPAALWALVFLVAFPGALFFQFLYSESLFLLLLLGLWWALKERR